MLALIGEGMFIMKMNKSLLNELDVLLQRRRLGTYQWYTSHDSIINYIEAEDLGYQVEWIASLTHQALNGITDAYNHNVHKVRNIQEQVDVAAYATLA